MIDYFIHIDDYTNGRLTESAKEAFEAEMSINEELRLAVDNHDIMNLVVDMAWEDDARQVAVEALKGTQQKEAKIMRMRKLMAVAASLVVLLAVGFLLMENLNRQAEFEINQYVLSVDEKGTQISNENDFHFGKTLISQKQYVQSVDHFKKYQSVDQYKDEADWHLILLYTQLGNKSERKILYEKMKLNKNHKFLERTKTLINEH